MKTHYFVNNDHFEHTLASKDWFRFRPVPVHTSSGSYQFRFIPVPVHMDYGFRFRFRFTGFLKAGRATCSRKSKKQLQPTRRLDNPALLRSIQRKQVMITSPRAKLGSRIGSLTASLPPWGPL